MLELGIEGCWVFSVAVTMIQACALWLWGFEFVLLGTCRLKALAVL